MPLPDYMIPARPVYAWQRQQEQRRTQSPAGTELDPSVLSSVGRSAVGGLSAVGNVLDLPGSMVRDVLALAGGKKLSKANPFDQLLPWNWTTAQNRTTGRDLLRQYGMAGKKDTWGNFAGGIGAEILTDPLTYMTFGASAVGKAGQVAKKAGLLDDAAKASKFYRMTNTLGDALAGASPEMLKNVDVAAKAAGTTVDALRHERLGGLVGIGLPFMEPSFAAGSGRTAERIASGMDTAADAIKYGKYSPVRPLRSIFDHAVRGARTRKGMQAGQAITRAMDEADAAVKMRVSEVWSPEYLGPDFDPNYLDPDAIGRNAIQSNPAIDAKAAKQFGIDEAMRRGNQAIHYAETGQRAADLPDWMVKAMDDLKGDLMPLLREQQSLGALGGELLDQQLGIIDYWPRVKKFFPTESDSSIVRQAKHNAKKAYNTRDQFMQGREKILTGHRGGTSVLNDVSIDRNIADIAAPAHTRGKFSDREIDGIIDVVAHGRNADGTIKYADKLRFFDEALPTKDAAGNIIPPPPIQKGSVVREVDQAGNLQRISTVHQIDKRAKLAYVSYKTESIGSQGQKIFREQVAAVPLDSLRPTKLSQSGGKYAGDEIRNFAKWAGEVDPRHAKHGVPLFETNPIIPLIERMTSAKRQIAGIKGLYDYIAREAHTSGGIPTGAMDDVWKILEGNANLDTAKSAAAILDNLKQSNRPLYDLIGGGNINPATMTPDEITEAVKNATKSLYIPREVAEDAGRMIRTFSGPEETAPILELYDKFLNAWKTGVTAIFPAFHARNRMSGLAQNYFGGAASTWSEIGALNMIRNKVVKDASKLKLFDGRNLTDAQATAELNRLAWAHGVTGGAQGMVRDLSGATFAQPMSHMPGTRKVFRGKPLGTTFGERSNPLNIYGVLADDDVWTPTRIGRDLGSAVEDLNRISPFIELIRQGYTPAKAAQRVKLLQVDYHALTATERQVFRRLFPWYSFQKGITKQLADELIQRPQGRLGRTITTIGKEHSDDPTTPDYIQETAAVSGDFLDPLIGAPPKGTKRYLSSFGLMQESPLATFGPLLGGDVAGTGLDLLSQLNPIAKAGIEGATGQSLFQRGAMGGRPLSTMDPGVGRTMSNLAAYGESFRTGKPVDTSWRDPVGTPGTMEFLLANSPLSRIVSTTRTLTDPRKSLMAKAVNLGTGLRVSDVSPAAQDAILRDRSNALMMELGGQEFSKVFIPDEVLEKLPPAKRVIAEQYNELQTVLRNRGMARKEAKK